MRLGCCAGPDHLDALVAAGFDFVEPQARFLEPGGTDADFRAACAPFDAAPLRAESFNVLFPKAMPVVGPRVDDAAVDTLIGALLPRAAALGAKIVVFGSGGSRAVPDGFSRSRATDQIVALCARIADGAARCGITLAIEPLHREACNFINTVAEAADLVSAVSRPEVRVLADLYHMELNGEPLSALDAAIDLLAHVHVPVPALRPGLRPFEHAAFLGRLKALGYAGRISVEDNGRRFADFDTEARPVRDHLHSLWHSAAPSP